MKQAYWDMCHFTSIESAVFINDATCKISWPYQWLLIPSNWFSGDWHKFKTKLKKMDLLQAGFGTADIWSQYWKIFCLKLAYGI